MDSKISQLPSANKIYDHDLLVAVTGYNTEGSYPDNVKISFDRIRKDIVRLHEMIFMLSGFSGYYNTGDNTITITSHQIEGNLINLTYGSGYPYIQSISTTGLNATASTGVYLKTNSSWPYSHEIGILEKIYDVSNTYTIPTGSTSLDEYLLFPLVFPSNIKSLTYSKWKCEGYYKNISLTTYIPEIQPTSTGPLGEAVSWSSYSIGSLSQGYIIPALFNFTYLLTNNTTKTYTVPSYDYSDVMIHTNHNNIGSKSRSVDNAHFLAFFDIQNTTSGYSAPSGGLGFILSSPWFHPPVATLNWNGTYYVNGTGYSTNASINSTGYVTNISINGHRFFEIKAV